MKREQLEMLETGVLLENYNELTGRTTSKFASRETGIDQTLKAFEEATDKALIKKVKANINEALKALKVKKRAETREKRLGIFNKVKKAEQKAPRPNTKRAKAYELMSRPQGATVQEVMAETGWDFNTARAGITCVWAVLGNGLRTDSEGRIRIDN